MTVTDAPPPPDDRFHLAHSGSVEFEFQISLCFKAIAPLVAKRMAIAQPGRLLVEISGNESEASRTANNFAGSESDDGADLHVGMFAA